MIVSAFKSTAPSDIPDEFLDTLPEICFDCGSPTEMTEALTQLKCSNPKCPCKVIQRLVSLAQDLGIKNLGESAARAFIDTFNTTNPLLIFAYEPDKGDPAIRGKSIDSCINLMKQFESKRKFTLAEYVRIANIPFLQTSTLAIFGGYDDINLAYQDIEAGGIDFIQDKLSIAKSDNEISVRAMKVYESLMTFKEDLLEGVNYIEIIPMNTDNITSIKNVDTSASDFTIEEGKMLTVKAVCSTEVGGTFRTKADFYATINNIFPNIHVDFLKAVTKDIDYLVWAGADGNPNSRVTNKVSKARAYNEKGSNIKIVTALQFISAMNRISGVGIDINQYKG